MDLADWAPIIVAAITIAGGTFQARRKRPVTREIVKQDVELLGLLPEGSEAKRLLAEHIDATIRKIVEDENQRTRDYIGSCLAVGFLLVALFLMVVSVGRGGNWWWLSVPAVITGLFGAVGLGQDAVPRRRDARGRPL
ncbi:hypothetical protein AB0L26_06335 [Streptomyces nondiastaticus]|uniref:hypothetical protein n=1 Tax=Streptomyces nondiastaticus TaxID=3154512 RepID=UPI0034453DAB